MADDLQGPLLHRWVWVCQEKKGLAIRMRHQHGGRSSVKNVGREVRAGGGCGTAPEDGQLHRDSGSHWAWRRMRLEGGGGGGEGRTDTRVTPRWPGASEPGLRLGDVDLDALGALGGRVLADGRGALGGHQALAGLLAL